MADLKLSLISVLSRNLITVTHLIIIITNNAVFLKKTIAVIQFSQCVSAIEGALPGLNSLNSHNHSLIGTTVTPTVQMRNLRHREVRSLVQLYMSSE